VQPPNGSSSAASNPQLIRTRSGEYYFKIGITNFSKAYVNSSSPGTD